MLPILFHSISILNFVLYLSHYNLSYSIPLYKIIASNSYISISIYMLSSPLLYLLLSTNSISISSIIISTPITYILSTHLSPQMLLPIMASYPLITMLHASHSHLSLSIMNASQSNIEPQHQTPMKMPLHLFIHALLSHKMSKMDSHSSPT